mgnify:FL=1
MYEPILISMSENNLRYLIVGAVALGLHGYPRSTFDLDILPDLSEKNLDILISIARKHSLIPKIPEPIHKIKDPNIRSQWFEQKNLIAFPLYSTQNPLIHIDVIIHYQIDFELAFQRKTEVEIEGKNIFVAGLDDLLLLKNNSSREKDVLDSIVIKTILERKP